MTAMDITNNVTDIQDNKENSYGLSNLVKCGANESGEVERLSLFHFSINL